MTRQFPRTLAHSCQAENARLALTQQKQEVALQVRCAYLDHQAAHQRLVAAEAQRNAAEQALNAVHERYRVGAATAVELTQAQAGATQAQGALVNARYTLVFQQALMAYYTGDLQAGTVREALGWGRPARYSVLHAVVLRTSYWPFNESSSGESGALQLGVGQFTRFD